MLQGPLGQRALPRVRVKLKGPQINQGAVAQAGGLGSGLLSDLGNIGEGVAQSAGHIASMKLSKSETKALRYLQSYHDALQTRQPLSNPDEMTRLRILNPTSLMQLHLENTPYLSAAQKTLSHQWMPTAPQPEAQALSAQGLYNLAQHQEATTQFNTDHPMESSVFGDVGQLGGLGGWGQKLLGQVADTAVGVGPGLYHLGGGLIHHPLRTDEQVANGLVDSFGQTIEHPIRDLKENPINAILNATAVGGVAAGTVARAGELSKTAQLARAGEITRGEQLAQAGKTLLRPQPMERSIQVAPGVRVHPPAFSGALGGYLQTKLLDPLTEKAIAGGNIGLARKFVGMGREFKASDVAEGMSPAGRAGKMIRQDTEQQMQIRRGLEEVKVLGAMKPGGALEGLKASDAQKIAFARGAAKTHLDLWKSLYDGGAGAADGFFKDPQGYVGIRQPPKGVKMKAYSSEQGIAREFRKMVETDPAKLAASPEDYSFIPRGTWQRMKLYEPGSGHAAKALDMVDRGTQIIRIGRFLHPGYAAWAVQNGLLHVTQAGMFAFRNAFQLRHQFERLTPEEKAVFDNSVGAGHFGGGIARATEGSEGSKFANTSRKLAGFWHRIDDRYWRRMSLIHELNHQGFHNAEDWGNLMRHDPQKFRRIARKAQQKAIDYSEMSPAERATLQKVFTAWGWTRGASTYTARYMLDHPVQGRVLAEVGKEGQNQVNNFYSGHNGMVPSWLAGYLPLGHGNSPTLLGGGTINPGETFGNLLQTIPGATKGQTQSLSQDEAPVPSAIQELISGHDRYGNAFRGNKRITQPFSDMISRFQPLTALKDLMGTKQGGGTFAQGPLAALENFFGIPAAKLNDAGKTAALGEKDYEQSLGKQDEITFRYQNALKMLPQQVQLYTKRIGSPPPQQLISKLKADYEAIQMRDQFQYSYASAHGANSYKSLPAMNKVLGAVQFVTQHKYASPQEARSYLATAHQLKNDKDLETLASEIWSSTLIGSWESEWKSYMKELQPLQLTPARP